MDLIARKGWLAGVLTRAMPGKEEAGQRDRVCVQEVWQECLNGEMRMMKNSDAREINRVIRMTGAWEDARGINFGYCGQVRGFSRKMM